VTTRDKESHLANNDPSDERSQLRKTLGPITLWGLGVGYVISGEYFGWNLGLPVGGTYGMLFAFVLITIMYVTFVFSYAEMACAIPRAGGVFVYSARGLGLGAGYLGGIAQAVEFVFAPPAIALAIGGYAGLWLPAEVLSSFEDVSPISATKTIGVAAYVMFTALNIWGVKQAAIFELVVTLVAVVGLILFTCVVAPRFRLENFTANPLPNGWAGALAAIPFAIWFYLAIEGVANVAEEARNPQRDVPRGFGAAIVTLVVLACCAFFGAVGVGGWERVVYEPEQISQVDGVIVVAPDSDTSDNPLPLAMGQIVGTSHVLYHALIAIGLFGLVASFNGIILASGRALFEMGRVGFFFRALGRTNPRTGTPVNALLVTFVIGVGAILFLDTAGLITMAAFGAVTLYIVSMVALIRLRKIEPDLVRPYKTPFYPVLPIVACVIAVFSLLTMTYFYLDWNPAKSYTLWYFGYVALAFVYYLFVLRGRLSNEDIASFQRVDGD
jgi:ethanolamine permease